jgi:hypothetical protein
MRLLLTQHHIQPRIHIQAWLLLKLTHSFLFKRFLLLFWSKGKYLVTIEPQQRSKNARSHW